MEDERLVEIKEKPIRSVIKAISWRITGTMDTILISFLLTGSPKAAFSIGLAELFTKMLLYYTHERVWSKLKFGREVVPHPEYEI
ncbi:MAG: DUF2061 domain-containing protein [Leptospiraceae bacterium]|nr:DUF2061 domain-containing protein [Leptospiraceae bacterium]MCP5503202.1 DUF2061 domain-containing protein [Leptospiraceae bacterium]